MQVTHPWAPPIMFTQLLEEWWAKLTIEPTTVQLKTLSISWATIQYLLILRDKACSTECLIIRISWLSELMAKQMLSKEPSSVLMDKKDLDLSLLQMDKLSKVRSHKLFDFRMGSLCKLNLSMEVHRASITVNLLQALDRELLLQANLMVKAKWVAILPHQAVECNLGLCLLSVTRFQERKSLWK
jgi:hypothetical protein